MKTKYVSTCLSLLAALLCTMGCNGIKDDLSGCLGNIVSFSYKADDGKEHLTEYVDGIDVFVYNEAGMLIERHYLDKSHLIDRNLLELVLPEGKYRVVAVANAHEQTTIAENGQYEQGLVSRPELTVHNTGAKGSFDFLYLGEQMIESKLMDSRYDIIQLYSQHVKIHAEVLSGDIENEKEWFVTNKSEGFHLMMGKLSARFDFTGTQSGETSFDLPFSASEMDFRFKLDFNTLRFRNDDPLTITLMKGNRVLCAVDAAQYIAQYKDRIEITDRQEAVLNLYFRQNPLSLHVTVKPWEAIDVIPIP